MIHYFYEINAIATCLGKTSKKTANLMTSGLKVGGGLFQSMISKKILMVTSLRRGWGSEVNVMHENTPKNPQISPISHAIRKNINFFL